VSDTRVREAERRWRESGVIDDEAAWLAERVRAGLTRRLHLEWLTFFGDATAARAVERLGGAQESALAPYDRAEAHEDAAWVRTLLVDDWRLALRVMLAVVDHARRAFAPHDAELAQVVEVLGRRLTARSHEPTPEAFPAFFPVVYAVQFGEDGDTEHVYWAITTSLRLCDRAGVIAQ
jgi:hypothetical protein